MNTRIIQFCSHIYILPLWSPVNGEKVRYAGEQIIRAFKEAEEEMPIVELSRKFRVSDATYYNWKAKYGGVTVSDAKKLKELEDKNRGLKSKFESCYNLSSPDR